MNALRKQKNDKKKMLWEAIVSFYQNKDLVRYPKTWILFLKEEKEKVIAFESSKIWDDTMIIENIYVK